MVTVFSGRGYTITPGCAVRSALRSLVKSEKRRETELVSTRNAGDVVDDVTGYDAYALMPSPTLVALPTSTVTSPSAPRNAGGALSVCGENSARGWLSRFGSSGTFASSAGGRSSSTTLSYGGGGGVLACVASAPAGSAGFAGSVCGQGWTRSVEGRGGCPSRRKRRMPAAWRGNEAFHDGKGR